MTNREEGRAAEYDCPVPGEVLSVSSDEVVLEVDGAIRLERDLSPGTHFDFAGVSATTLERPGEYLCSVATTNDVHFGETVCGEVVGTEIGPVFRSGPDEEPYPSMMNRHAVAEILAVDPAAMIVKGDLTDQGRPHEFEEFLSCYRTAFEDRLWFVRGNHDCALTDDVPGSQPLQVIEVDGAMVILLDTSRPGLANGTLTPAQLEELDELARTADRPIIVLGHHPIWDEETQPRQDDVFTLLPEPSERLIDVVGRRPSIVTYAAGHTHRNRVIERNGVPFVEVASVKEFPGVWCEYQIFDGGILQVTRRILHDEARAWSDKTKQMFHGQFASYAWGSLDERCRLLPIR